MKPYFSHDEGARNDPKLVKVLMRLGQAGKGVYWDLVEMLYEQGGYLLIDECESYAFALRTDCDLILKLVNDFGLFENDGRQFWSETALERMKMRDSKKEARAQAGAKGGKIKAEREAAAKALLEHEPSNASGIPSNALAMLPEILASKRKESKVKESKEASLRSAGARAEKKIDLLSATPIAGTDNPAPQKKSTPGGPADVPTRNARPHAYDPADISPALVLPFATDSFRQMWTDYRQYREEQKHPRYSGGMMEQEALRSLNNLAGGDEARALEIISQSVRKGWKDLFKLDEPRAQHPQQHAVERGAKPTAYAATGARALAEQLAVIDEEQRQQRLHERGGSAPAGAYTGQSFS